MMLNYRQKKQLEKQIIAHKHNRYEVDIDLGNNETLKKFIVYPNVLRPEGVAALQLARYLFSNNGLYQEKIAIDMGCGSGIQGVAMGLYGADRVNFSDISEDAFNNTQENVSRFKLQNKSEVFCGDLFEKIDGKAHIIVFNHPFFHGQPLKNEPVSIAMLDDGKLIHRFLDEAKNHLFDEGVNIMPYFHLAGEVNDPFVQGPMHGYKVVRDFYVNNKTGLQRGPMSIYKLFLP